MKFRELRADEIEVRVSHISKNNESVMLLLYKDARCDMNILDEVVGSDKWQREHYECKGNLFCRVGIKSDEWVWKSDCGTESNTEKQKGEASDSFKRACFNWGIGRELYTAPIIWVKGNIQNGKCYDEFIVSEITYKNGNKKDTNKATKDKVIIIGIIHKINKFPKIAKTENCLKLEINEVYGN